MHRRMPGRALGRQCRTVEVVNGGEKVAEMVKTSATHEWRVRVPHRALLDIHLATLHDPTLLDAEKNSRASDFIRASDFRVDITTNHGHGPHGLPGASPHSPSAVPADTDEPTRPTTGPSATEPQHRDAPRTARLPKAAEAPRTPKTAKATKATKAPFPGEHGHRSDNTVNVSSATLLDSRPNSFAPSMIRAMTTTATMTALTALTAMRVSSSARGLGVVDEGDQPEEPDHGGSGFEPRRPDIDSDLGPSTSDTPLGTSRVLLATPRGVSEPGQPLPHLPSWSRS